MTQEPAKCVLVVDDDPDICEVMQLILESHGYRVVTAESGTDALDKLRAGVDPCLILLDLMMPNMNGIQFRREQRRDPALAAIPVVMISAGGDVAAKAAAVGLQGLLKPIDLGVLLDTVKRFGCVPEAGN
jgi:CheY-like chemotaxis protein